MKTTSASSVRAGLVCSIRSSTTSATSWNLHAAIAMNYDVYSADGTLLHGNVSLERAAEIVNLSVEEMAWAIEEHGRCDTADMVVVRNDDVWPGPGEG